MIEKRECDTCKGHGQRWIGPVWRLLGRVPVVCEVCKGRGVVYASTKHRAY